MSKTVQETLDINGLEVKVQSTGGDDDYISLTDLAREKITADGDPSDAIRNWMRNRNTIEFLGIWEGLNNPNFKPVEFDGFRKQAGLNSFTMTPTKWIKATGAIGIKTKRGRYGSGTFAHVDSALDFAAWISPEFRLYVFQEYKRLKQDEASRLNIEWQNNRMFASLNHRVNTDAIKDDLPKNISKKAVGFRYASEVDMLNVIVFGQTAQQWQIANPTLAGNMRDYASVTQNLILANLESMNAELIKAGKGRDERFRMLQDMAQRQRKTFEHHTSVRKLEGRSAEE